jgi:hypothetical protein
VRSILTTPNYFCLCDGIKIDYIAASFVRKASDVNEIRAYVKELMAESSYPIDHPHPKIISKIESTEVETRIHTCLSYHTVSIPYHTQRAASSTVRSLN